MTPELRRFVTSKIVTWTIGGEQPSLKALCLSCCDRRTLAYQLGTIHETTHHTLMLRTGLRLGFLTPLGQRMPAPGHA
jgi:hypothetical protein